MKRQDVCDVRTCLEEIINNEAVKKNVKRSGLMCYEFTKILNIIDPLYDSYHKFEKDTTKAAWLKKDKEPVLGPNGKPIVDPSLVLKLQEDLEKYFEKEDPKFKIEYLVNMEDSEIISQYVSGKSVRALFTFLTKK